MQLIKFIQNLFSFNYNNNLEEYLKSKNVTTTAEVDYWINQYHRRTRAAYY